MHIPLEDAYWCENCQSVINCCAACPCCATTSNLVALEKWIGRTHNGLQTHLELSVDTGAGMEVRERTPEPIESQALSEPQALLALQDDAQHGAAPGPLPDEGLRLEEHAPDNDRRTHDRHPQSISKGLIQAADETFDEFLERFDLFARMSK
jgi:hypothetical protein